MNAVIGIAARDLRLALRHGADSLMAVVFFVLVVVLFPLGLGPEPGVLARIAAGVIWIGALLAALLSLERLFLADYEDGSLDLIALSPTPLGFLALAKTAVHWITTGVPLIAASPLLAIFLGLDAKTFGMLAAALLLGTPTLSLIGAIGAALVLGARRGGVLLSLLILPLNIPILIFGVSAVEAAATGRSPVPHLAILGALLLIALPLSPWATAAALRQAIN
jgi:heme exporter protein B